MLCATQDFCHLLGLARRWSPVLNGLTSHPFMTLAYEESAYLDSVTLAPDDLLQYVRVYGYALRFH